MKTPVTSRTRAPWKGRDILAPCGHTERVYHFAWSALRCAGCGEDHAKPDYVSEVTA